MKNILVYAYQLSPFQGSEAGLAWDYIVNMSKTNKLVVLYGTCEEYHQMGYTNVLEKYIQEYPIINVSLVPVRPSFSFDVQDYSIRGITKFYKQYERYQKDVYETAKRICEHDHFDLVHFLGPIGYREPGYLWKLGLPYMWGPVGGMTFTDLRLLKGTDDFKGCLQLVFKKLANYVQLHTDQRVKEAMQSADLVIGCTTKTKNIIKKVYSLPCERLTYLTQNCIKELHDLNISKFDSDKIHMVWIGRIDFGKSLITTLRILSKLHNRDKYILHVVGDGDLFEKCNAFIKVNNLSKNVVFHGKIPRDRVFEIINNSHLHIITSLLDVNPTIFWEASAFCVPTITIGNNGTEDIITPDIGIVIKPAAYNSIIKDFTKRLDDIACNPECLKDMANNLLQVRVKYSWSERCGEINRLYDKTIENWMKNVNMN